MENVFRGTKLSNFYDTKNDMIETTCKQFEKWKQNGHPVNFVMCNNAEGKQNREDGKQQGLKIEPGI